MASEELTNQVDGTTIEATEIIPAAPSKKSLKKAAKAEKYAAMKLERRAREKEAKKEKKRARAEQITNGEINEDDEEEKKRQKKKPRLHFGGKVVVDLGFDDKMSEKEIQSLCSQLAYTYSANRQASYPFSLVFSSLNGRTLTRLENTGDAAHTRWSNTEWWQEDYHKLWSTSSDSQSSDEIKRNVVYLTADTQDELTELRSDEIYIIGGLVDRNRYKNLCFDKAQESGIRTARLPIGRYLSNMPTRKVLTVNQVFEIMLKWVETRDWEQALYTLESGVCADI
ncbi:guanine-1-methyltransferase-domain-containing protein [Mucidula mucida]|nr:guanine-1-methyltransferase-domain-containing protein [Mucidula mucida]